MESEIVKQSVNVFDEIRSQLDFTDVAQYYGVNADNHGMVKCPFHEDRHASAKLYPERLRCFACGRSWDAVALVAELYKLKPLEAARKLSDDFRLGLFTDKPVPPQEVRRATEKRERDTALLSAFERWERNAYITICDYRLQLVADKLAYAPVTDSEAIHPHYAESCHRLEYIEYFLDWWRSAEFDEKIQYYKNSRREVQRYADAIRARRDVAGAA